MQSAEPNRTKPRILITGASGFVGRQTLAPLQMLGFDVHALSRGSFVEGIDVTWHACNLFDYIKVKELCASLKPTHLLHCAWVTEHRKFWDSPENELWLKASINLFETFAQAGGCHIIGIGSCAEYSWNRHDSIPWKETDVCLPHFPYGQAKLSLALWLKEFAPSQGIRYAWARLFLLFGKGENPDRILPYLILSALKKRRAHCSSGTEVRDFLDTETCGKVLAEIAASDMEGVINVASGKGISIRTLSETIARLLKTDMDCEFGMRPDTSGSPDFMVADITKLRNNCHLIDDFDSEQAIDRLLPYWGKK